MSSSTMNRVVVCVCLWGGCWCCWTDLFHWPAAWHRQTVCSWLGRSHAWNQKNGKRLRTDLWATFNFVKSSCVISLFCVTMHSVSLKKVWTLAIAPLTWVRLVTSSALQSRKWQLIGMSQWCRSALCGHPLPVLMDNWTHGAASRHTIAPISHTRPSPHSRSYYSFPVPLRVGGWVGLSTQ